MTLVFFGTSGFGLPALEALAKSPHRILAVVTTPERPSGRGRQVKPSPVRSWAQANSVPTMEYSAQTEQEIASLRPDLLIVISFGRILPESLLSVPKIAPLNVHASLLPRWRGASPMQSAILAGDKQTGVCVMRLVKKLDAGDILLAKRIPLSSVETLLTLEPKLAVLAAEALLEAMPLLEKGTGNWTKQNEPAATLCVKIKKEDGRLKGSEPAGLLDRKVRAFLAWPGAYTFVADKRLLIKKTRVEEGSQGKPGMVLGVGAGGIRVSTSSGTLVIEELQLEGRKTLPAAEFLKGFPLKPGDYLL